MKNFGLNFLDRASAETVEIVCVFLVNVEVLDIEKLYFYLFKYVYRKEAEEKSYLIIFQYFKKLNNKYI